MALLNANQINSGASLPYASERFAHVRGSEGVLGIRRARGVAADTATALLPAAREGELSHWAEVINGGSGYGASRSNAAIEIANSPVNGGNASGQAKVVDGKVVSVQITNRGHGFDYYKPPKINLTSNGKGAVIRAIVSAPPIDARSEVVSVWTEPRGTANDATVIDRAPQDITHLVKSVGANSVTFTEDLTNYNVIVLYRHFPTA